VIHGVEFPEVSAVEDPMHLAADKVADDQMPMA
jgi:hypothetical protein